MTTASRPWQGVPPPMPSAPTDASTSTPLRGSTIPPWKCLHRDTAMNPRLKGSGLAGIGLFALVLAQADCDGCLYADPGDTMERSVALAVGFPEAEVTPLLGLLIDRRILVRDGEACVRFRPDAWERRQFVARAWSRRASESAAAARRAPPPSPAARPLAPRVPQVSLTAARPPRSTTERTDRHRFAQVAKGAEARGALARYAHATGMTFEAWLASTDAGRALLTARRAGGAPYAEGVTASIPTPVPTPTDGLHATAPEAPSVVACNAESPLHAVACNAATALQGVAGLARSEGKSREDNTIEEESSFVAREVVAALHGAEPPLHATDERTDLPLHVATQTRVKEGTKTLRVLIDRANARGRGVDRDRVQEIGASSDAIRWASLRVQESGATPIGDVLSPGVRLFDAIVAVLRSEREVKLALPRWTNVQRAGWVLPLAVCEHKDGLAMQQLIAHARKRMGRIDADAATASLGLEIREVSGAPPPPPVPFDFAAFTYEVQADGSAVAMNDATRRL